jgi:predicted RNA-binding protein YlxR (DUF448 family)
MNNRTCVICKKKDVKEEFIRFCVINTPSLTNPNLFKKEIALDINSILQSRGYYFCKDNPICESSLNTWLKRNKKIKG